MKKVFIFVCSFILTINILFTQEREVVLDYIKLNGKILEKEQQELLIFSKTDSISFFYHLESKDTTLRTPFIFKVIIKNSRDSSVYTTNTKIINYKNLPEDHYSLTIQAFDPRNQWVAKPLNVEFVVNNKLSSIVKEFVSLKKERSSKTLMKSETKPNESLKFYGVDIKSAGIGLGIGLILLLILIPILLKVRKGKTTKEVPESKDRIQLDKIKYEQILLENSNLRAEIAALRGQIDALNSRAEELRKQNIELKDKVEKLSNSKAELEELQQQKDELFALIIHDIKNPAALIKNLVELLRSYDLTATEQQEIIDDILLTSNRIVALSQEVSRILALESSLMSLNLELGNVNDVIREVVKANSPNAKSKNINIFVDLDEKLEEFKFDRYKVYEVLDNLMSNAIKFTQKGGEVRVTSQRQDDKVVVQVIDNGLGLSDEDISKAFQRGAKLSAKPTSDEPSSGLGLWIVKRLVEAMKGKVWVKSVLGKGSTFAFSVPILKEVSINIGEEKELQEEIP
ncbi:MAG: HAMP domain-containing histidine kinase [Ignavibacteria bacterium]|nr:HAMP domain-containing histidine kinase [Ignavibacteria bacterium]